MFRLYKAWRGCGYGRLYCLKHQIKDWFWDIKWWFQMRRLERAFKKNPKKAREVLDKLREIVGDL